MKTNRIGDDSRILAELAANPFPENPWVKVTADGIIIKASYSDALHRMLRWVPKVKWIPERRQWIVPLAGSELIRSALPEIMRLAEATHEEVGRPESAGHAGPDGPITQLSDEVTIEALFKPAVSDRDLFRNAARFLFGTDWQRDTAKALGREESSLACWLAGDKVLEDDPLVLLNEMRDLMRRRVRAIEVAATQLDATIEHKWSASK